MLPVVNATAPVPTPEVKNNPAPVPPTASTEVSEANQELSPFFLVSFPVPPLPT